MINHARTAAYLSDPALSIEGISMCDVLEFGGCETYPYEPRCTSEGGYIDTPGTSGNTITVADFAALDISGDMTLIAYTLRADWTPASTATVFGRGTNYRIRINTSGQPILEWDDSGAGAHAETIAETLPVADGGPLWLAMDLDVSNGGNHIVRAFTSPDGVNWYQLGDDNVNAGTTTIQATSTGLQLGSSVSTDFYDGQIAHIEIRNGLITNGLAAGTVIFSFDGEEDLVGVASNATTFVSSSGHTVTVNHSGSPETEIFPFLSGDDWVAMNFDTPTTDPAPWYNAAYPESADALGFYIEEWTGLDDKHVTRRSTPWGGGGGGEALMSLSATGRVMALNLFLFGRSEEAVEYLFRWLGSTLSGVCETCATDSILIRRFCGSDTNPEYGMAELRKVGLTRGLGWEADIGNRGSCYLRRASVILTAGDPCMYLPSTEVALTATDVNADLITCLGALPIDPDRTICRPSCSELTTGCRTVRTFEVTPMAAMAPVVTFDNNQAGYAFPFRAIVYADPLEIGADPNPCGLEILGEIYVRAMPPWSTLVWDVAGREVRYGDATVSGIQPSYFLIEPNDPPRRRFFALPCSVAHLVLEPATMCVEDLGSGIFASAEVDFDPPLFPAVSLSLQERISCP